MASRASTRWSARLSRCPSDLEDVSTSNSVRLAIEETIAVLELASPDPALRLEAVKRLQSAELDETRVALVAKAESRERDTAVRDALRQMRALTELQSADRIVRLSAAKALRTTVSGRVREALKTRLASEEDGEVRVALTRSLRHVESSLAVGENLGIVFSGISLASILLLAALGLAVTYGLMGVINMAHGEMMMIGAYATYVVQNLFRAHLPDHFQWYLAAAAPVAFLVAALVGVVIERSGDPLPLWTRAGDAARHLGRQPHSDAGGAHPLRRAECAGREPRLDVRPRLRHRQSRASL